MADDTPNRGDIQSMLNDLTQKKQGGSGAPSGAPSGVPANLPTGAPPPAPRPSVPPIVAPPQQTAPAPAPRVPLPPKPATPSASVPQKPPMPAGPPHPSAPSPVPIDTLSASPKPKDEGTSAEMTTEMRTMTADVSRLSTGQAPAPVAPPDIPKKSAPGAPPTPQKPIAAAPVPGEITIPESSSGGMGRKAIYGLVGAIVLVLLGYVVFSLLGGDEPQITATPTPEATLRPTPTPTSGKDLSFYFGQLSDTLTLPDTPLPREDFNNRLRDLMPSAGSAKNIEIQGASGFPSALSDVPDGTFGIGGATLIFAQTEHFDPDGLTQTEPAEPRLVYVIELADASAANMHIQAWEAATMSGDLAYFYRYNESDALVAGFTDATYRQVPVRYRNFPYADLSVDWAIVPASNNKNYLVITGSRESMFFAVDQLLK